MISVFSIFKQASCVLSFSDDVHTLSAFLLDVRVLSFFWLGGSRQKRRSVGSLLSFSDDVHNLSAFLLDVRVSFFFWSGGSRQKRQHVGSLLSFQSRVYMTCVLSLSFLGLKVLT